MLTKFCQLDALLLASPARSTYTARQRTLVLTSSSLIVHLAVCFDTLTVVPSRNEALTSGLRWQPSNAVKLAGFRDDA